MGGRGRVFVVALCAVVASATGAVSGASPAAAADDGVRYEAHTSYVVDIGAQVVRVTFEATFTNELANYFFPEMPVPVLAEATNFTATTDSGRSLRVARNDPGDDVVTTVDIDLDPDLLFGQSQTVRLTYDLPSLPPRSEGFTRVNAAYATFAAFTAGDPNLASVEILVPDGFEVEHIGSDVETSTRDGVQVLSSGVLADPLTWSLVVVARNDSGLLSHDVAVDSRGFVVRAWPGDDEWVGFVENNLRDGIPALEDLVGEPWPSHDTLTVVEAASPYVYGYAGWFLPADNVIEVGDALDRRVILHELSHLWFNDAWFADRWISEAFAEEYASRAVATLGDPLPSPQPVDPADPGAVRLDEWGQPTLSDETIRERELFGYNTSFWVLRTIADEIGADALRSVIDAIARKEIAYRGDPVPELVTEHVDSRRLLDLFDEVGGSTIAADVFAQHVLAGEDLMLLEARTETRSNYNALVGAGDGWTPPFPVRVAMGQWEFDAAEEMINRAYEVLDVRDEIERLARALRVELPESFEPTYESSEDLDDIAAHADDLLTAIEAITEADATVHESRSLTERIGLWRTNAEGDLREARRAFVAGDADTATAHARDAVATIDDAASEGTRRIAIAASALLVIVALAVIATVRIRRRP